MLTRRRLFELAGASSASYLLAHLLPGCGSSEPAGLPQDPMGRWWLSGNYAPVPDEIEALDLPILEGAIPPELDGLFLRNGANPAGGDSAHWFVGDGMLHGVRIENGRALWYRNRWIRTQALASRMPDSLAANRANTSVVHHAGRTLALYEVGPPHEIDPDDLSTIGVHDFAGTLRRPMAAHPRIDPSTGEMGFIGYAPFPPYLTYHVVDATGALVRTEEIALDHAPMMHDFQMTRSKAIFFDLPVHFDASLLAERGAFPFRWVRDAPARIGVLPRGAAGDAITWIEIPPCFLFHTWNAYDDGEDRVVIEGCRLESLWEHGVEDASQPPIPHRFTLDVSRGTAVVEPIADFSADFPRIDLRRAGTEHRSAYALRFREGEPGGIARPQAIVRIDRAAMRTDAWEVGEGRQPDEAVFVPAPGASGDDEGWVLSMVFDESTLRSEVVILDAQRLASGPVARIAMPRRVPFGFHGEWIASEDATG